MIKVLYSIDDDHTYTYLSVKGHAEYADSGKDLICASVSSIIFGFMNALDEFEDVKIKELTNEIVITSSSKKQVVNNYFNLVLIQLKTIEESYGEYLRVERKKNI